MRKRSGPQRAVPHLNPTLDALPATVGASNGPASLAKHAPHTGVDRARRAVHARSLPEGIRSLSL